MNIERSRIIVEFRDSSYKELLQGFKNIEQTSSHSVEEDCEICKKLKKNFPNKYLLVSIMGKTEEEWAILAKAVEEAGADGIELNF